MDGRNVYRGSRDPHYTHANVYWLYDENLQRVGCSEHDTSDHGNFRLLWFGENPFSTLLQETWTTHEDVWSQLPEHVFEKFLGEGWTTPAKFLEQCLRGSMRIVTPQMITSMPKIYACDKCGRRSLSSFSCATEMPLDFPDKTKILFVDDDMMTFTPPPSSRIWNFIAQTTQPHDDGSSHLTQAQAREQAQEQAREPSPPPSAPQT